MLCSCDSKDAFLGEKNVQGSSNLLAKFYQERKFDMTNAILFSLESKDSIILGKKFLVGSHDQLIDAKDLFPFVYDDILYICYPYPEVYVMKDIRENSNRTEKDMFAILKKQDSLLTRYY